MTDEKAEKKAEIEVLFKKFLKDFEETSKNDEIYREDIDDFPTNFINSGFFNRASFIENN